MLKQNYKCGCVKIMNCHSFFLCLFTCLTLIGVSPMNLQANEELTLRMESDQYWNSQGLNLQTDMVIVNEGNASISMVGLGYKTFETDPLNTENIPNVSDTLLLDFYIGDNQPNPWWYGQVMFHVECPSANIYNQYIDKFELTGYEKETWHTFKLSMPANVVAALNGSHTDFVFRFALNVNYNSGPYNMDNIRFSGSSFVVWSGQGGSDGGGDRELFFWNGYSIQQITENGGSDLYSQIFGSSVVSFQRGGSDAGPDSEIFFWNGTSLQQITENNSYDISPQISGNIVVWESRSAGAQGIDHEIFLWNRTTNQTQQITNNDYNDNSPQVCGNNVVWHGNPGDDPEIFFWNGSSIQQITDNEYNDYDPQISSNNVVWLRDKYKCEPAQGICEFLEIEENAQILFWNGTTNQTQEISTINNDYNNFGPQISGTNVVWYGQGGSDGGDDFEIFFWDGNEVIQITQNNGFDIHPQISGNNVVWDGQGGSDGGTDFEIFFWNGTTKQTEQLTENDYNDVFPQISGGNNNVVWEARGGSDGGDDSEIFFWNGTSIRQITVNNVNDGRPHISPQ